MMIEVELSAWEQQCCGDPFRSSSTVTWKPVARDPSKDGGRPVARYREEHQVLGYRAQPEVADDVELPACVRGEQGGEYAPLGPDVGSSAGALGVVQGRQVDP